MLAPREQLLAALKGSDQVDRVVVTAVAAQAPPSDVERRLRNLGMCLVVDAPPPFRAASTDVKEERILLYVEGGDIVEQRRVHTPAGTLNAVVRHSADMREARTVKRLFQKPADYAALTAMVEGQRFTGNAEEYAAAAERLGADALVRPYLGSTPMYALMHELMGLEVFAEEWAHRRQQVVELYKALIDSRRRLFEVVAHSPAPAVTYGGQLNAREIGEERFNRYYLPAFHEFADAMHGAGKLAGVHIGGDPEPLAKGLARTHADYVEGFRPTHGFGVDQARRVWPNLALWAEVPPDVHQRPLEEQVLWIGGLLKSGREHRVLLEVAAGLPLAAYRKGLLAATAAVEESMKGKPLAAAHTETPPP